MEEFIMRSAKCHKNFLTCWVGLVGLSLLFVLGTGSVTSAQEPSAYVRLVRVIETGKLGIANPVGLVFSPAASVFLLSEARKPNQTHSKIAMISFFGDSAGSVTVATAISDPLNVAFDAQANRLVFFDQTTKELIEIQAKPIGYLEPAAKAIARFETRQFDFTNPQGIAFDPKGRLFVLDAAAPRIFCITPDSRLRFDGAATAQYGRILTIELNHLAGVQPRGVAFNPNTNHLYVLSSAKQTLYEFTEAGEVVASRDLSFLELSDPQGMAFAPSGDLTDDPALMSLYVADSGQLNGIQGRGQIVELSLTAPAPSDLSGATNVRATLVNTIKTSNWSPPSPDPMGMAYISSSGSLLVSDSEVEEMSIFKGVNVFESTLQGKLAGAFKVTSFSKEPTDVAFNPNNRHLFISDDDADKIFEIDPGTDGRYFTSDDIRNSFDTRTINIFDPEGIAYDSWQGHLFIVDGVNAEVYEIKPGLNGIFDGQPPVGDDQMSQFDTVPLDILDPEGIGFNSDNGHLFITGHGAKKVVETTASGTLINVIDISSTKAKNPSGLAYAPSSVNPAVMNLYISARGVDNNFDPTENDGRVYEISIPGLSINDVSVIEGNTGTINAVFTVTLSSTSNQVVTVDYGTADGTATAGTDYVADAETVTFSPGATTQTIAVVINGEALDEPHETFFANLSNPTNATITDNQGQATITNDDPAPSISINDVTVTEGNAGPINAVFTVTLSAASGKVVTVDYATADGTATADSDYLAGAGTVNFPAGTLAQTITVFVNADAIDEPMEAFFVNLGNPSNATIADGQGQGTVIDNDGPLPIIVSFSPTSGPAGTEVTITGNNFTGASSVNFNRTPASTFVVDSPTQIRATVPSVATTGKISVTTPGGMAMSESDFTVTITLEPTDDARVNSANPSTNYGSSTTLRLRKSKSSSTTINSYLKFNVGDLSGLVQSAKLRLYVTDSSKSGGSVHLVSNNYDSTTTPWTEGGLNWNNAPAIGGAALSSAEAVSVGSWVEFDVTSAITGEAIYSFGLKTTLSDAVYYSSKEDSNKPELVVQLGSGASLAAKDANFKPKLSEQKNEAIAAAPLPEKLQLALNYPNPFNVQSTIAYALPQEAEVRLVIYDVLGRQVRQLVNETQPAGYKRTFWNGRDNWGRELSSGVYFVHLVVGQQRLIRKIMLMK